MRYFVLFILFLLFQSESYTQDFSNKGKEFWVAFLPHQPSQTSLANLSIYITSDKASKGKIYVGSSVTIDFEIQANSPKEYILNRSLTYISGSESANDNDLFSIQKIVSGKFIRVVVDDNQPPVVVYAHVYAGARSAATIVLPVNALDRKYMTISYNQTPNGVNLGEEAKSQFAIIAVENDTKVKIQLRKNNIKTGTPFEINLPNAGDIYTFQDAQDLSGTEIESISSGANACKKIAVFSGSSSLKIPNINTAQSIDPLFQQCYPINTWGYKYFATPFNGKSNYIVRVIAKDDGTILSIRGIDYQINRGEVFEIYNSFQPAFLISSNNPICVTQYSYTQNQDLGVGDPEMIILNSVEQNISDVSVFLSSRNAISDQNINVVIRDDGIPSFRINGQLPSSSFIKIPNTDYSYLQERFIVPANSYLGILMKSDIGFNAICYGFGSFESYGYSAGTNLKNLNQFISIKNEFALDEINFAATCKNAPFKFSITLDYKPLKIQWRLAGTPNLLDQANSPATDPPAISNGGNQIIPDQIIPASANTKERYVYKLDKIFKFSNTGTDYSINLILTKPSGIDGCTGEEYVEYPVKVYDPPTVTYIPTYSGCVNEDILLTTSSQTGGSDVTVPKYIWNIDGNEEQLSSMTRTIKFTTEGQKIIKLKIITSIGCISEDFIDNVNVNFKPTVEFKVTDVRCIDKPILFTDLSQSVGLSSIVSRTWSIVTSSSAENFESTLTSFDRTFTQTSVSALLTVRSTSGCSNTFTQTFPVFHNPEVLFKLPVSCVDDISEFDASSSTIIGPSLISNYDWDFGIGNGFITGSKIQSFKYTSPNDYVVKLKLTSDKGCVSEKFESFRVNGANPEAKFEFSSLNSYCSNRELKIADKSKNPSFGDITRLEIFWDNDNPNPSNTPDVTIDNPRFNENYKKVYTQFSDRLEKTLNIRVKAYSGQSCFKENIQPVILKGSPVLTFNPLIPICNEADPLILNPSIVDVAGSSNGKYIFTGLGVTNSGIFNPSITGPGTNFSVTIRYESNGCYDEKSQSIDVLPSPEAKFTYSSIRCETQDVLFDATSSVASAGAITSFKWEIDGNSSLFDRVTTQFRSFGKYEIKLMVTTNNGCVNTKMEDVFINSIPEPDFKLPIVCLPLGNAQFTNTSISPDGTSLKYSWDFGDIANPGTSMGINPLHIYKSVDKYFVKLKAESTSGCFSSTVKLLDEVYPEPIANINDLSKFDFCTGDELKFIATDNPLFGNIKDYYWKIDNQILPGTLESIYQFKFAKEYNVIHYFITDKGCRSNLDTLKLRINNFPSVNAGQDLQALDDGKKMIEAKATGFDLIYKWVPSTFLSKEDTLNPFVVNPQKDMLYKLIVTGRGSCSDSDEVKISVLFMPSPPNTFTPNGDGVNDLWEIKYLNQYPGNEVEIYTTGGQLVYRSVNYSSPWNGTNRSTGNPLPIGTYYYVIDPKSGRKKTAGYVTILR